MKRIIRQVSWVIAFLLFSLGIFCYYEKEAQLNHQIANYQTQLSDDQRQFLVLSDKGQQLERELQNTQNTTTYLQSQNEQLKRDIFDKDNALTYYQKRLLTKPFVSGQEFETKMKYYQSGLTYLGGQCVAIAQSLVYCAHKDGYEDVETEILENRNHAVVKAFIGNEIWLYDYEVGMCWLWITR